MNESLESVLSTGNAASPILPSATIILLRDGEQGLEALLVQRNQAVKHMGGMWVFPGGKVDPADYPADKDPFGAAVNAAIRETREEVGLNISADQLVYFSHWTTPEGVKKRFSTWFFLAILEDGQEVEVDGGEILKHRWVPPADVLAEVADVENPMRLVPPTFVSLHELANHSSCAQARAATESAEAFVFAPRVVKAEQGMCFLYGGDAGFDDGNHDAPGVRHRMYMVGDQLDYVREL